jgi:hypothetical protein
MQRFFWAFPPPGAEGPASATSLAPFSFGCNKLVSSDPRGLSMSKGKSLVITSRISVTPIEDAEGVSTVRFSGEDFSSSARFDSTVFCFLGTEGFGVILEISVSPETSGLFDSFFFLSLSMDLISCLFRILTTLFFFTPWLLHQVCHNQDIRSRGHPSLDLIFVSPECRRQQSSTGLLS